MANFRQEQRKWVLEIGETLSHPREVADPLGFSRNHIDQEESSGRGSKVKDEATWKQTKAWEAATAPGKNLLMVGFMMWMAGSTVHIFSMGIVFSALYQPISALRTVEKAFEPYKDSRVDLLLPKIVFILLQLLALAIGLWKLHVLGLLPTASSDWLAILPPREMVEFSSGGVSYM